MSIKKYVLISLVTIVVLVAAGVLITAKQLYSPTQGKKIGKYTNAQKALLVIDVQEDYTGLGARNRGYKVTVVRDAIMTRKNMSDILKRYEKNGIALTSSRELTGM